MTRFRMILPLLLGLSCLLSGCQSAPVTKLSAQAVQTYLSTRVPADALPSLTIAASQPLETGEILLYKLTLPAMQGFPSRPVLGFAVVQRRGGQWQVTEEISTDLQKVAAPNIMVGQQFVGTDYAVVVGTVAPDVAEVHATFDTGEQRSTIPTDGVMLLASANAAAVCAVTVRTSTGSVDSVLISQPIPIDRRQPLPPSRCS